MDKPDISRRETFRLARFGVLLAAGLGVAESVDASQKNLKYDAQTVKRQVGEIVAKFYKVSPDGFALFQTTDIKGLMWKQVSEPSVHYTIKFWKGQTPLVSISDVIHKDKMD